ncbi:MAG: hypothetical protein Q9157_004419 [Trypethelium eluteriae]
MALFGNFGTGNKPNTFGSFGGSQSQQSQPQQSSSIFGTSTSQPQQQQGSNLFSSFGQQQQASQQPQGGSVFGAPAQPAPSTSLFGATQQPQQPQQNTSQFQQGASVFGGSILGASQNQLALQQSRLGWNPGSSLSTREKTIPEQMETMLKKWSPDSPECVFQYYFYNSVAPEYVPYYTPGPGEDEKKWEEALAKKPSEGSVPVLGRGFAAMGERLKIQVAAVTALQTRLHEINNSLTAMMQEHDLVISVRAADAKRKHAALAQRCLALAAKVQVLRNRGYAMDSAEEELRKRLVGLEKGVFDPGMSGRQEEIWARMVSMRERTRVIQEESEKLGKKVGNGEDEGLDEEVIKKTKKILSDYDSQLSHLRKEVDQIRTDFEQWEKSTKPGAELNGS